MIIVGEMFFVFDHPAGTPSKGRTAQEITDLLTEGMNDQSYEIISKETFFLRLRGISLEVYKLKQSAEN